MTARTATTTRALEVAKSNRRDLGTAMSALERATSRTGADGEGWRRRVGAALERLAAELERHIHGTDASDGLFEEILRRSPRMSHRVDRLREEHDRLREAIAAVIARLRAPEREPAEVLDGVLALLARLSKHRQAGADLVWESYSVDIGDVD